ncbi:MAG: cytochrome b/b6 domain-containing protein [Chloroflexota bacterium]|nr:cytochrome b/b6 domain-containing protein [Chloroflexota bacterium]
MRSLETVVEIKRTAPAEEHVVRFSVSQRFEHFLTMMCFLVLLLTGLPQKFDEASLSVWIVNSLGGIDNVRFLHRVFACVFIFGSVYHLGAVGLSLLRGRFRPTMVPTLRDFVDALAMLRYSVGLSSEKPAFDRYDYRQKFEYWGIVYGGVIMIVTGLTLWFPTYLTRLLPGEIVPAAKEMHSGEALLALLVIVTWHLYSVMLSPTHFPGDWSIFTGRISREKMIEEHPLEYARLTAVGLPEGPAENEAPGAEDNRRERV